MSLNEQVLRQIWIEQNLVHKEKDGSLRFQGATQNLVDKALSQNRPLGLNRSDVMEIALEHAVKAVFRFKIKDSPVDWDGLVKGDKDQVYKLWKSINLAVEHKLKNLDPWAKRSYDSATKSDIIIKPQVMSLDKETEVSLMGFITEEHQLQPSHSGNETSPLAAWFEEQGKKVLSKKQLAYVDKYLSGDFSDRNGYLPRIRKRLEEQYAVYQSDLQGKIEVLEAFQEIADSDEELDIQNQQLANWLKAHLHLKWLEELVGKSLSVRELYRVAVRLENKLAEFKELLERAKEKPSKVVELPVEASNHTTKTVRKILLPSGVMIDEALFKD